jgi:hypothetical protein
MPNVIITPSFANIRAREKNLQGLAVSEGIRDTGSIIAQALLVYSQRKHEEDTEKLSILQGMQKQYGENIGQPALDEMDKILKRKGLPGLPRDTVTGGYSKPTQSLDQVIDQNIIKDPKLLHAAAYKAASGGSEFGDRIKELHNQAQEAHEEAKNQLYQARTDAMQEKTESGRITAATNRRLKVMEALAKQRRLKLDQHKALDAFTNKAEANMWKAVETYNSKKTTPEQRVALKGALEITLRRGGVSEENLPKFFADSSGDWSKGLLAKLWNHLPLVGAIEAEHAIRGVSSPEIPPEGIKKGTEVVPGVTFEGEE